MTARLCTAWLLALVLALVVGCGSGDSSTSTTSALTTAAITGSTGGSAPELSLYSDNDEKGDPQLGPDRIRITPQGLWTPVYSVALKDLAQGEEILAGADIQMTNCRPSDLAAGSTSSCKGTAPYNLNPKIETRLVLSGNGKDGRPSIDGEDLGPGDELSLHGQAPPLRRGAVRQGRGAEVGDRRPDRQPVRPRDGPEGEAVQAGGAEAKCNVLQLTHGQGRLGVARERRPGLEPPVSATGDTLVHSLPLAKTKSQKQSDRKVVYSLKLDKVGPVLIRASLLAEFGLDYPTPPLVNKELILADSPKATTGKTVEPQNGENCQGECHYIELGLLPCLTQADLDAGNDYLNLVAFSSRASAFASPKDEVKIRDGGYLGVRQYDASLAPRGLRELSWRRLRTLPAAEGAPLERLSSSVSSIDPRPR